jgi:hypothetical protein
MFDDAQVCEKTETAVKKYVAEILAAASAFEKYKGEFDVEYEPCPSATEEKLKSSTAIITSDLGVVIVFPDFKTKSAKAAIVNLGLIKAMQAEGYDKEYIENEGSIYSTLFPLNKESTHLLGYYLTHKILD